MEDKLTSRFCKVADSLMQQLCFKSWMKFMRWKKEYDKDGDFWAVNSSGTMALHNGHNCLFISLKRGTIKVFPKKSYYESPFSVGKDREICTKLEQLTRAITECGNSDFFSHLQSIPK
jgi:hypothetical protein